MGEDLCQTVKTALLGCGSGSPDFSPTRKLRGHSAGPTTEVEKGLALIAQVGIEGVVSEVNTWHDSAHAIGGRRYTRRGPQPRGKGRESLILSSGSRRENRHAKGEMAHEILCVSSRR
jgi:hypothetical protein